ncbi:MAG: hypothetical protein RR400_00160 [Clostridia bacterium]
MKISEIIGSRVFSVYEGEYVGFVASGTLSTDFKKIEEFLVVDEDRDVSFVLSSLKVKGFKGDIVLVKNLSVLKEVDAEQSFCLPIGKCAMSLEADDLGRISDFSFDQKFRIEQFETTKNKKIANDCVVNIGENALICNMEQKKVSVSNFRPSKIKTTKEVDLDKIRVSIMKIGNEPDIASLRTPKSAAIIPPKISGFCAENLIGTTAMATVVSSNGQIVLRKGEKVSKEKFATLEKENLINKLIRI